MDAPGIVAPSLTKLRRCRIMHAKVLRVLIETPPIAPKKQASCRCHVRNLAMLTVGCHLGIR